MGAKIPNMTKLEKRLHKLASARGLNAFDVQCGWNNCMEYKTAVTDLQGHIDYERGRLGENFIRQARQRIISAGAGFTPVRICRTPQS